uniref:EB domain-containing protein n=1 Tax=Acrobeloides nanus TaxID=290746 RepID=A0A914CEW9_9BILA
MFCGSGVCSCLSDFVAISGYCWPKVNPGESGCIEDLQCEAVWPAARCSLAGMCECPPKTASHPEDHHLPNWVNQTIKDEIWRLYDLCCTFLYSTNILARLRAGPLFAEILNRMKSKVQNTLDSREKFYAYSAHDTSVASILAAFGIFPEAFPLYATLVLVEMHQKEGQNIVRIFYKNETDQPEMFEYEIPGCKTPCTLEKLEEVRKHVIPLNWESECGLVNWYDIEADTYLYIIVILSLVCILLTLQMVNMTLANRRFHKALKGGYKSQSRRRLLDVEEEDPYPE